MLTDKKKIKKKNTLGSRVSFKIPDNNLQHA